VKVLVEHLSELAESAIQRGKVTDYQSVVQAYDETWISVATEVAAASVKFPKGRSEIASSVIYAIRQALIGEAVSAVELSRVEFGRIAMSTTYSLLIRRSRAGDWSSVAQLMTVMESVAAVAGPAGNSTGDALFDYVRFRFFELARIYGLRLSDHALSAADRTQGADFLSIHSRMVEVLIQQLLRATAIRVVVRVDKDWTAVLPDWRYPAPNATADSPDGRWSDLLKQRRRIRFAIAVWAWTHPIEGARNLLDQVGSDLPQWSELQDAYLEAKESVDDNAAWWGPWVLAETGAIPSADIAGVPTDITNVFLWFALARSAPNQHPLLGVQLAPYKQLLRDRLEALQPPSVFELPDLGARKQTLRAAIEALPG
jgi:hypothetical protein